MRLVLPWLLASCVVADPAVPEIAEATPPAAVEVSAQIWIRGEPPSGAAVLYWPSLPSEEPIPVASAPAPPEVPWEGAVPADDDQHSVVVRVDRGDLAELRERTATAGAPQVAHPPLVEIEARAFPGLSLGPAQLSWEMRDAQRVGTSATHVKVVRYGGGHATLAVAPGQEDFFAEIASAVLTPRDQDLTEGWVALDAVVSDGVAIGDPVRLVWPPGTDVYEDVVDGGFLYLGPDARGFAKIATLRYEKHLVSLRARADAPPTLVPDERVAFEVPLKSTPDPSRMTQTTHLTDGRLRSTDYPYAAVGDRSITVLVPADDVEWLNHWIRVSGGRLSLAGLRQIDRSGFDPPPPGFPASTRLRR